MIRVDQLSRRYGDFKAVDNISFSINSGEIVGLLGHNGAGKTTVMKMLTGYLEPSGGTITIGDCDIARDPDTARAQVGYLPENLPVYPEMTVIDYLDYCAGMRGMPDTAAREAIAHVIATTDLRDKATAAIATLSRGYKQRVGVAQALLHRPKVLILDEPTNGLDPMQTRQMRELIKSLASTTTVILSTHIMQEVDAVCDRVLIIDSGRLVVDETLAQLRSSNVLQVETDATTEEVSKLWDGEVKQVTDARPRYHLIAPPGGDLDERGAEFANALIGAGHRLFAMSPLARDLETVFREAHELREVRHAA